MSLHAGARLVLREEDVEVPSLRVPSGLEWVRPHHPLGAQVRRWGRGLAFGPKLSAAEGHYGQTPGGEVLLPVLWEAHEQAVDQLDPGAADPRRRVGYAELLLQRAQEELASAQADPSQREVEGEPGVYDQATSYAAVFGNGYVRRNLGARVLAAQVNLWRLTDPLLSQNRDAQALCLELMWEWDASAAELRETIQAALREYSQPRSSRGWETPESC